VIPPKANRRAAISCDRDMYRWRHLIENAFAKLKEFRAVATRYDKTDTSYAATIHLAAIVIASRRPSTDPKPAPAARRARAGIVRRGGEAAVHASAALPSTVSG
jgi:hypothetical protein